MPRISGSTIPLKDGRAFVLRSPEETDLPAFLDFQKTIAGETNFTMQVAGLPPPKERVLDRWNQCEADPVGMVLMAFCEGKIVGTLGLHPASPPHPWTAHLAAFGMMVRKEFWGAGIAHHLIEAMHRHAKARGILRIEAMVRTANVRGIAFYLRHGYSIEGTRKMAAIIDGAVHDELYIAKLL